MSLWDKFYVDIGIDLGTCNTLVYVAGRGIVCSEPSVVAIQRGTNATVAVGIHAKRILGKTPEEILAVRPLRDGVIADLEMTHTMISHFLRKALGKKKWLRPRMVIGIPACITQVERKAVEDSARRAGAVEVKTIIESRAAAIGANIPIHEPAGHMVCDIGGGTSEVAVLSLGGIVVKKAIRLGGDEFDEAITKHVRSTHNLVIGEQTAENLKIQTGNAYPDQVIKKVTIKGTDTITGLPRSLEIDSVEIREALAEPVSTIVEAVKETLSQTPPELVADIVERGIVMTGGGALLKGLPRLISEETGVPVMVAEDPLLCVAIGAGRYFEYQRQHRGTF